MASSDSHKFAITAASASDAFRNNTSGSSPCYTFEVLSVDMCFKKQTTHEGKDR
jgi:hypothetical protein